MGEGILGHMLGNLKLAKFFVSCSVIVNQISAVCSQGGREVVQPESHAEQAHAASQRLCPVRGCDQRGGYRPAQEDLLSTPKQSYRRSGHQRVQ